MSLTKDSMAGKTIHEIRDKLEQTTCETNTRKYKAQLSKAEQKQFRWLMWEFRRDRLMECGDSSPLSFWQQSSAANLFDCQTSFQGPRKAMTSHRTPKAATRNT